MPEFRQASEVGVEEQGDGWTCTTLADARHVVGMAMRARLWRLEPGATGPEQTPEGGSERFLYVVSGSGTLVLEGRHERLDREDVAWIEPGDRFRLVADPEGPLTVLDAASA